MTASSYINSLRHLPFLDVNAKIEDICGVQRFFEHLEDLSNVSSLYEVRLNSKDEYGDWQTNMDLALKVCCRLKEQGIDPKVIIEPTCGKGHFILAALQTFDNIEDVYGIEIYKPYIDELKFEILQSCINKADKGKVKIHLYHHNIFNFDFDDIKKSLNGRNVLVLGNPPWVTNSKLCGINSRNLPTKSNLKKHSGLDAITGKSNFDIAECITVKMMHLLEDENAQIAMLLKNSVIKNIIYDQRECSLKICNINQYNIDAKKEFDVSVAASLFCCTFSLNEFEKQCRVEDFYTHKYQHSYGWSNERFVSDIELYQDNAVIDGESSLVWWSGIKHDCAKVMELLFDGEKYINGLGEIVDVEDEMLYPLIKSSDIKGKEITYTRKYVIVTQKLTSDDTGWIEKKCPKTYRYLMAHAEQLDSRGSRIYKGRPRFSMFGVGKYSFKPYKIAVSGLYKNPNFAIIPPIAGKSVMLDDTCYMLGFDSMEEAIIIQKILNSSIVQSFVKSLIFVDAKRVINKDLLMRIDLIKALEYLSANEIDNAEFERYKILLSSKIESKQLSLF